MESDQNSVGLYDMPSSNTGTAKILLFNYLALSVCHHLIHITILISLPIVTKYILPIVTKYILPIVTKYIRTIIGRAFHTHVRSFLTR